MKHELNAFLMRGILAAALVVVPQATQASTASAQVERLLQAADGLFENQNYSTDAPHRISSLETGLRESLSFRLEAGVEYALVGVCDTDCKDIDLRVLNSDGRVLEVDDEDDDSPIVLFTPSSSGAFNVSVSMISCSEAPCAYGVTILARRGDGASAKGKGGCDCGAVGPSEPRTARPSPKTPPPNGIRM